VRRDHGIAIGSAVGAIGAALAATLGILCCAGPAVVAVLGAGGALAAARLEPYRPWLLGASLAMLAVGFWRSYRPSPSGQVCATRTGRVTRVVLWIAAVVTLLSFVLPEVLP
jgi:mercuric ion transport protein